MAPLADAVRLVNGDAAGAEIAQSAEHVVGQQPLRRDIEHAQLAILERRHHTAVLFRAVAGVQGASGDASRRQVRHLVAHQGDQRRDDDGQVVFYQRRKLVAEGFAAAGRHDGQHRFTRQRRFDHRPLPGTEFAIAEHPLQSGRGVFPHGCRGRVLLMGREEQLVF